MDTSTVRTGVKKIGYFLSEIWYISIICLLAGNNLFRLQATNWQTTDIVITLIAATLIVLLAIQFIKRNCWIDFYLGILFAFGSFWMILAMLSEYQEFPLGTEPRAMLLLGVGGLLFGSSFLLAGKMVIRGVRNIYAS